MCEEVLKKFESGLSYATVGHHFRLNESSICGIKWGQKDSKDTLASCAPVSAKVTM